VAYHFISISDLALDLPGGWLKPGPWLLK